MRARFIVGVIAVVTICASLLLQATWVMAAAAGVAVIVVAALVGRLVRRRRLPDAALASRAYPLSPREVEVAVLLAQGLASKEIGEKLGIEKGIVDKHFEHIKDVISNF